MRFLGRVFAVLFLLGLLGSAAAVGTVAWAFWHYGQGLPDYKQLADYKPPISTRVHAGDGRLLAEFATESRVFVPIESVPEQVKNGFIAAEDQDFYSHFGVDLKALARAVITNVYNVTQGRRLIGASTITQQVAKNFLLNNEVSMERKIKEAILALRIERALSKDRILELYLNEIFLGNRSYGIASAALNYFGKSLDDLTVDEIAYLAALPKAPNNYHPTRRTRAAIVRRNWVIDRMVKEGFVTATEAEIAKARPLGVVSPSGDGFVQAGFFLEEVRRELEERFGEQGLYGGGLSVRTTLDPVLQDYARIALREGLLAYDRRHGYRGPVSTVPEGDPWHVYLSTVKRPNGALTWQLAAVLEVEQGYATLGFEDQTKGILPLAEVKWARQPNNDLRRTVGPVIKGVNEVLKVGDIILVEPVAEGVSNTQGAGPVLYPEGTFALRQVPEVNGGIVAMDPHTGRVLAMSGGWSFRASQFNRATQALRQPGSAFKPFVFLTALENGYTPATIILDAPIVVDQGPGLGKWKPANFSNEFYGPSPMRVGIEKSRNLMTVRLAQAIGMDRVVETAARFGIDDDMSPTLAMSLGAGEARLIDMVSAYGALVNGGKQISPSLIDRIQDRDGRTVFRHDARSCMACEAAFWDNQEVPVLEDARPSLTDPISAYQIVTMLEGVVQRGTGRQIATIGKPIGGKTGTTNDSRDTWFVGFSPDLAVGVFVGFDTPTPLGIRPQGGQETGSSVAAPIFKEFMEHALADKPAIPFRTPTGVRMVRVDAETGNLAEATSRTVIVEAFRAGSEPGADVQGTVISGMNSAPILPVAPLVRGALEGNGAIQGGQGPAIVTDGETFTRVAPVPQPPIVPAGTPRAPHSANDALQDPGGLY